MSSVVMDHEVQTGASLAALAARFGVPAAVIARDNALHPGAALVPGQILKIASHHLLPQALVQDLSDGIVINVPQRMLFRLRSGRIAAAYPAALGRASRPTPTGEFRVTNRQLDKTWVVPPSIQAEMRAEGRLVLTWVPPGPDNRLGRHWIGLSLAGIGIHGTNAPLSIHGLRSHGRIRLHPDDAAALYADVGVGEPGRIVYAPVMPMRAEGGRIWFEANPDAYRRDRTTLAHQRERTAPTGLVQHIDWLLVAVMLHERAGRAGIVDFGPVYPWQAARLFSAAQHGNGDTSSLGCSRRCGRHTGDAATRRGTRGSVSPRCHPTADAAQHPHR